MNLGEIYKWNTDRASGYNSRTKMHVYICEADALEENTFLFISSHDWYCDYEIKKSDYKFLDHDSYISCSTIVTYSDGDLAGYSPKLLGQLAVPHLRELHRAIAGSDTMAGRDVNRVCNALKVIL